MKNLITFIFLFISLNAYAVEKKTTFTNEIFKKAQADGKIVIIDKVIEDEYFMSERIQISIFMSPLNVHINRNPIAGIVSNPIKCTPKESPITKAIRISQRSPRGVNISRSQRKPQ